MPSLEEAAKDPNYNAAAAAASKAACFAFIGTFLYMLFGTSVSPGLIGGAIFFGVGIFVASLGIAAPLMVARVKAPTLSPVAPIANIAITIFATRWVYLWLFAT